VKRTFLLISLLFLPFFLVSQSFTVTDNYFRINATANDPLYTTYAATISRTSFPEAMAYKMDYYSDSCLVNYSGDRSGRMFSAWKIDDIIIGRTGDYFKKPVVIYSFPDMMIMEYQPVKLINVRETFLVYSSSFSLVDMEVRNNDSQVHEVSLFPVLYFGEDSVHVNEFNEEYAGILSTRNTINFNKTNNEKFANITEFFTAAPKILSYEYHHCSLEDFNKSLITGIPIEDLADSRDMKSAANLLILHQKKLIRPHETTTFRYLRGIQWNNYAPGSIMSETVILKNCLLRTFFEDNLMLFLNLPQIRFENPNDKLLFISALNLSRGSVFPASGNMPFNYCSSRNTITTTNQVQQLLDEVPGLMGYVYADNKSAENALRVFFKLQDQQKGNLQDVIPCLNWIGMEIFKVTRNKQFLKETYVFGGNHINNILKKNIPEIQNNPGLNLRIIKEEYSLARMAKELGKTAESVEWFKKASVRSSVVEQNMWDESNGFYYSSVNNGQLHLTPDESQNNKDITGFLPLWAYTISKEHASGLVNTLTDSTLFWRKSGVPEISAAELSKLRDLDHPNNFHYNVGLLKNYMIYAGLRENGYSEIAKHLASKLKSCVSAQLSKNHNFWEYYSPDDNTASGIINYFPDSIIAKLLIEENVK
jgi:hypothetical protein